MIVGDPRTFAIESEVSRAYESLSCRGLGFFVIHLGGLTYGVRAADATMLACSFDEVEERLRERGAHCAFLSTEPDAGKISDAIRMGLYSPDECETYLGVNRTEFMKVVYSSRVIWAPDGDEAFDDRSFVLQFDVGQRVRLIGFRCDEGFGHDPSTLRDIWLEAGQFYAVLDEWRRRFEADWVAAPKEPRNDGSGRDAE